MGFVANFIFFLAVKKCWQCYSKLNLAHFLGHGVYENISPEGNQMMNVKHGKCPVS